MYFLISSIFYLFLTFQSINSWVTKESVEYQQDSNTCILSDGSEVKAEEKWYDDDVCVVYECNLDFDDWDFVKYTIGCEEVWVANTDPNRNCEIQKPSGNFPDCCPKQVCQNA